MLAMLQSLSPHTTSSLYAGSAPSSIPPTFGTNHTSSRRPCALPASRATTLRRMDWGKARNRAWIVGTMPTMQRQPGAVTCRPFSSSRITGCVTCRDCPRIPGRRSRLTQRKAGAYSSTAVLPATAIATATGSNVLEPSPAQRSAAHRRRETVSRCHFP
ncbi:hypothetical protein K461DRAFT_269285 [Myriangium duriaei CBS 260.36]|uniref:Uncharacterized protein n=1 Tax=Myriangium duriaei CBS 260.36 TaxID=1168546 RepID=A0A9P4IWL6_9PEZI|nr:hypothetical protein K461DRAFT_269285 [Myriangium duriaei CBS 260.36]